LRLRVEFLLFQLPGKMPQLPEKIKLLHVVGRFGIGGTERQQAELIKRLPADRYEQTVAAMEKGAFAAEVEQRGVPVIEFPFTSFYNIRAARNYLALARLIRRQRFHLVHCHNFYSNIFGTIAARLAGMKTIITSRRDLGGMFTKTQLRVQRLAYRFSAAVLANSQGVKRFLIENEQVPETKIHCVYNGIDTDRFTPQEPASDAAESLGIAPGSPVVGMVGNLHPWKGFDVFIRIAAAVNASRPGVRFLIVGDGPQRGALEQMARELHVEQSVTFAGARGDIPEILALMSVFVLSSPAEGLPNAVLEAMACGLPVVASNTGGVPETVNDGETGFLVLPGDTAGFAEKILQLLGDPARAKQMGQAGRRAALENFSCESLVKNTQALYDEIMQD